jgi:hypothetical protein
LEGAFEFGTPSVRTNQDGKCERSNEKESGVQFVHQDTFSPRDEPPAKKPRVLPDPFGTTGRSGLDAGDYSNPAPVL